MKYVVSFAPYAVAALVTAIVIHLATVWAVPRLIMSRVLSRAALGGENVFFQEPLATSDFREIVRPSPDLAYSACAFDLTKGPIHIDVPLTAPYTSVALYSTTTDNYFVRDDRQSDGKDVNLVVTAPDGTVPRDVPDGAEVVRAPSSRGLAIVRRVVASADSFPAIDAIRKTSTCAPLG